MKPSARQRIQERSLFYTNLADILMVTTLITVAVTTGSLTILSEAVRGLLMVLVQFYSMWILWAIHRGRLSRFEYGVGKIEQFVWLLIGISLVAAALWVAWRVVDTVFSAQAAASPLGLTIAAIVNAVNNVINGLGFYSMYVASRGDESGVFGAQLRARATMLTATAILQVTLTIAALAKDAEIALLLDAAGAILIVFLKLQTGFRMIARGLPDLIDAPARGGVGARVRSELFQVIPEAEVVAIRTRRAGDRTYVRVELAPESLQHSQARMAQVQAIGERLRGEGDEVDISVAIRPSPKAGTAAGSRADGADADLPGSI